MSLEVFLELVAQAQTPDTRRNSAPRSRRLFVSFPVAQPPLSGLQRYTEYTFHIPQHRSLCTPPTVHGLIEGSQAASNFE